jgi:hypothetical protein
MGAKSGRGVLLHAMLGVDAETGGILGLATGLIWTLDGLLPEVHNCAHFESRQTALAYGIISPQRIAAAP